MNSVGNRLKQVRESLGMDKKTFAQSIGVTRTTVYNNETERTEPRGTYIDLIASKHNVSAEYVRSGRGSIFSIDEDRESLVNAITRLDKEDYEIIKLMVERLNRNE